MQNLCFLFPNNAKEFERIVSVFDLKEKLNETRQAQQDRQEKIYFRITCQKEKYIYARCSSKRCKAYLRYKRQGDTFELFKLNIQHSHRIPSSKNYKFQAVRSYLKTISDCLSLSTLKQFICKEFGLTPKQFYYNYKLVKTAPIQFEHLVSQLQQKRCQIYCSAENRSNNQPPELFLAVTLKMKENFKRYGEVVSFDFTFNLIKNVHSSGKKWKLGCFLGLTSSRHIIPFCLVISLYQTKEVYSQIFTTFFKAVNGVPRIIVTDEEKAMSSALKQMKERQIFEGQHYFDVYHILKNVRKKLQFKDHIILFSRIIKAKNRQQFHKCCQEAEQRLSAKQLPVFEYFKARAHLYCMSQIKNEFIGFGCCSSINESLHNRLKYLIPSQKQYSITVKKVLEFLDKLSDESEKTEFQLKPYEQIFGISELKTIRCCISKFVFGKFLEELTASIKCEVFDLSDGICVKDSNTFYKIDCSSDIWICQCGYSMKCGLPCAHILRATIARKSSIFRQISSRWMIKDNHAQIVEPSQRSIPLGRERASRKKLSL